MQKIRQLNRYYNKTLRHVFSSQFVAKNIREVPTLNQFALSIESKKIKKTHYLFIYLLTKGKKGHMIKYNIPWKFKTQIARVNKNSKILCRLSTTTTEKVLHIILFKMFPQVFPAEKKVLKLTEHLVKLIVYQVPLLEESLALQSNNGYLINISLTLNLEIPYATFYSKLFLVKTLKLSSYLPLNTQATKNISQDLYI